MKNNDDKKEGEINVTTDRRVLLKSIVAGSAAVTAGKTLSETWAKPLTDVVILPSHARTTQANDISYGDAGGSGDGYLPGNGNSEYAGEYIDNDGTDNDAEYIASYLGSYYDGSEGDDDGTDGDYTYGDFNEDNGYGDGTKEEEEK